MKKVLSTDALLVSGASHEDHALLKCLYVRNVERGSVSLQAGVADYDVDIREYRKVLRRLERAKKRLQEAVDKASSLSILDYYLKKSTKRSTNSRQL